MDQHGAGNAFSHWRPRQREGIVVTDRRGALKASLAGIGGLSLTELCRLRAEASPVKAPSRKALILLWMTGGPSHVDTWDIKVDTPSGYRGPFKPIATRLSGVQVCEHLPKLADHLDRISLIRSIDARHSNHEPNMVMQTANKDAEPRINTEGGKYPAIGAIVGKHRGPNQPGMPPYVVLNMQDRSHVAWAGYLGQTYDPFNGRDVGRLLKAPAGLPLSTLSERRALRERLDGLRAGLDSAGAMEAVDRFGQMALEMVLGSRARTAFDLSLEPDRVRERYGSHPWAQQALLARRLVESGVPFVTIDLSNHTASGTWDTHGDNIPPYGGISKGLKPLLPIFDHLFTTLVDDLIDRGLADDVLVIAMGEFGRTPKIGTQESSDGRDHWPYVMTAALAGGGLRHGQVIGASDRHGGQIKERPVTPGDLAATIYRHFGVPLDLTYDDHRGRPRFILDEGQPIHELIG